MCLRLRLLVGVSLKTLGKISQLMQMANNFVLELGKLRYLVSVSTNFKS